MTAKKSSKEMEAELKKMVGENPEKKSTEVKTTHEIEADLKRMLNMRHTVVVTKEDLCNIKTGKNVVDTKKPGPQKKEMKPKHSGDDQPHHHHHQHQEDPLSTVGQVESQTSVKKKKRKPKKNKAKELVQQLETDDMEKRESEDSDIDEDKPYTQFNLDLHRAKYLDDQLTLAILNELESEKIFPLKKKSLKFPTAKYFCRLCDYHCDNIPVCRKHASDARHRRRREIMLQDKLLKSLPVPSERHVKALDDLVEKIYIEHGLTDKEMAYRQGMLEQVQGHLREKIPDLSLVLYGSSLTGFGLKIADLNMDLVLPPGANPAISLSHVFRTLLDSEIFLNVRSDFQAKVPSVMFSSPCGTLQCQISVGNEEACLTSQYLATYLKQDERLRKLAVTFKYWAKVCELDKQDQGSLPAYCFGLMTIFYLQQCQPPVLPVLWRDLSEAALKRPKTKADVQNMFEQLRKEKWTTENEHQVGLLWRELLLFYGVKFDLAENIVSVRYSNVISRAERKWKSRRIAIEDPFQYKRNVARSLHNLRIFDYFYNCLRKTTLYFSLPTSHQNIDKYYTCKRKTIYNAIEREKQLKSDSTGSCKMYIEQACSEFTGDLKETQREEMSETTLDTHRQNQTMSQSTYSSESPSEQTGLKLNVEESYIHLYNDEKLRTTQKEGINKPAQQVSDCKNEENQDDDASESVGVENYDLINSTETESDCSIKENQFFEDCRLSNVTEISELESSCSISNGDNGEALIFEVSVHDNNVLTEDKKSDEIDETRVEDCDSSSRNQSQIVIKRYIKPIDVSGCDTLSHGCPGTVVVENSGRDEEFPKCDGQATKDIFCKVLLGPNSQSTMDESLRVKEIIIDYKKSHTEVEENVLDEVLSSDIDYRDKEADKCDASSEAKIEKSKTETEETDLLNKEIKEITCMEINLNKNAEGTLESDSENDMELESVDSSPLMYKKRSVSSPFGAEYDFKFDSSSFTDGKGPSVFCPICDKEGHLEKNCPEDKLPPVEDLPSVTKTHLQILTSVVKQVTEDFRLSSQEIKDREFVRKNLEVHIQGLYPDAQLQLFGSSMNGFGFHRSDLDICVTFKDRDDKDVDFVEHVEAICKCLKTHRGLYDVFPITTAKVPIVKFTHRNSQLEGDISMYNILAMENTRLLYTYASIDPRVQTLGYAIKAFAKVCDIGDASRGSLSSYAYILMMLHYLQHTRPPLVPVLQELRPAENPNQQHIVEGWNTCFFDDIRNLSDVWSGFGKNNQSVGELWLGFFRYYLEEFNFAEHVVCIRQFQLLTKFEKLWNGKYVAIEDPFALDHNLGSGLTRKMNRYILCTLINAKKVYGTSIQGKPDGFSTIQDYFFDKQQLVDGELPSDRLCRICGKIGHIARECSKYLARKGRAKEAAERKRREEMKKVDDSLTGSPQKGQGPRHFNNRDRQSTVRSLSDPSDKGSPARGHQQFYQRQNTPPSSQSPDMRQRTNMDLFNGNYQGLVSPRHDLHLPFALKRRSQRNPPQDQRSVNNGYKHRQQQGYWNQPPDYQNYDLRGQRNIMHRGYHQNYPQSPATQPNPQFENRFFEGSPQSSRTGERKVKIRSAQKSSGNKGKVQDVGITVNNEYCSNKDQG